MEVGNWLLVFAFIVGMALGYWLGYTDAKIKYGGQL